MSHDVSVGGLLAQANFGENQGSFEGIKAAPENRGAHRNRGKETPEKEENQAEKSSYKVDKLLQEQLESGQASTWRMVGSRTSHIKSRRKWTNLIHLGLGFL
jgi:hypothetical protein